MFKLYTQFLLVCFFLVVLSHPFDGVPTFALTDHNPRIQMPSNLLINQKIFQSKSMKYCMLIICKGIQKNSIFEKCSFIHDGQWGDEELIQHQKFHNSLENKNYSWLGFDASQSLGKFSGRDGKRM